MKKLTFLFLFFCVKSGFSQSKDSLTIFNHFSVEASGLYNSSKFYPIKSLMQNDLIRLTSRNFVSCDIGLNFYYQPISRKKVIRENLFSLGLGVNLMKYEVHHESVPRTYTSGSTTETIFYSPETVAYTFNPTQFYTNIMYTRFFDKYFMRMNAGIAVVYFKNVNTADVVKHSVLSTTYTDSNGNVVTASTQKQVPEKINMYPGKNKSINRQFGFSFGYTFGSLMPFISYQNDRNADYLYHKLGLGMNLVF